MIKFDEIFVPVWDTDVVYGETFTMYRDENGEIAAPFLYEPDEIIEVASANGERIFEEGADWFVKDGKLFLTEDTSAPFFEYDEVFLKEGEDGKSMPYPNGYLVYSEGHFFHDRQIAVTYKCKGGNWGGYKPKFEGERLKNTLNKLKKGEELKIVLFGDSISAGSNVSGKTGATPFQPEWGFLFAEKLRRTFGSKITYINTALGGMDSAWAVENVEERVISHSPDLAIIAFGMNDGWVEPKVFAERIAKIVSKIKSANSNTDVILVATSTPNPLLTDKRAHFYGLQHLQKDELYKLEGDGIAVANITDVQKELHRKKRFIDTTGNFVNHPNDFFVRIYAQVLYAMFNEEK